MRTNIWLGAFTIAALAMSVSPPTKAAPIIAVGSFPVTPVPSYISPLPTDAFLVPVEISGAVNLQNWQFDLLFDNTVVEEVDPWDGSSGIYGAEFTPGDPSSISFILSGFPFNFLGKVDTVAGAYPSLLTGPSGDGVLAFVLFDFLPGQETEDPKFSIQNVAVQQVPEPATLQLLAIVIMLLGVRRLLRCAAQSAFGWRCS
jgi:hypothetical protein